MSHEQAEEKGDWKGFQLRLIGIVLVASGAFLLAAMLGQLDPILSSWYSNPRNTWEFPFPFIFNHKISALLGWELIYGIIALSFLLSTIDAFMIGRSK